MKGVDCSKALQRFFVVCSIIVTCILIGTHAFGQEARKGGQTSPAPVTEGTGLSAQHPSDVFTLGVVEVTGEKEKIKTPVERVDYKEMREFNANRLPEALNLLPGVSVSAVGARNESNVFVRGFGPTRVPVFLDGIPIYVPYDRTFDFNRFTTFDLSEIIVAKGFTSVLYGPNTMGGAINLVTKKPEKAFQGDASVGIGSGNQYYGYTNVGTNQKWWYLQAGASYFNQDSYPMSNDFAATLRQNDANRLRSYSKDEKVNFKVGLTPAPGHEYAFTYLNQHGEKGSPPDVRSVGGSNNFWDWPKWDKESFYLSTQTPVGDKTYVKSRLYYDKFINWLDYYSDITYNTLRRTYNMGERSYYDDYTLGGFLEVGTTLVPNHNIKAAFHYKRDSHTESQRVFRVGSRDNLHLPDAQNDNATTSIGLEDTYTVTKKFYIVAGMSYDTLKGLRANKWSFASSNNSTIVYHNYDVNTKSTLNPQLGLFYSLTDTAKLHLTAERKTRFPTLKERYSWGNPTATTATIENPGLKPEEAINYEFGYDDVFFKRLRFKAALFHNDIDDAIQQVTFTQNGVAYTQNQNIQNVKQYGVELQAIASITKDLEAGVNYMYLDRQNESSNAAIAAFRLTDVPKNKVFAYAKYNATPLLQGLSFLGSLEYNSLRYSSSTPSPYGYTTNAFTLVNLNGAYIITKGLTVRTGVSNLFDTNYEYMVGYPQPGRTYFANLTYSF